MKPTMILLALLLVTTGVAAEEGCPPGLFPNTSGAAGGGCVPFRSNAGPSSGSLGYPAPSIRWVSRWGAIAIDETNSGVGTAVAMSSKRRAEKAAMLDCRAKGGSGCKISIAYHDQCAAIAWGDMQASVLGAGTIEEATSVALEDCERHTENCRIYYSDCSYPERVQ